MAIILVGLNYHTAPIELREKLALMGGELRSALEALQVALQNPIVSETKLSDTVLSEAVILSTCNRLEVYAVAHKSEQGWQFIQQFLCEFQDITCDQLTPHLYFKTDEAAVQHLMRVACGLDSMILGEPQILGQVMQALTDAQSATLSGALLSHLFAQAVHAGKRARTETAISRHTTSISHAAAILIWEKINGDVDKHILVVGAGEMAVLAAQSLQRLGIQHIALINRTYNNIEPLAKQLGIQAFAWHQLRDQLAWADVVISATGAPHTVIYTSCVEEIMPLRDGRPLLLVDIAVPRDIEETVEQLSGVTRHDIDDLQSTVDESLAQRTAAIPCVEAIVQQEMLSFAEWLSSRQVIPVINRLREWACEVAHDELEQTLHRLPDIDERTEQMIRKLTHRIVNKLLHEPTIHLRSQAAEGNGYAYAHAVRELFGLHSARMAANCTAADCERIASIESCNLQCLVTAEKA